MSNVWSSNWNTAAASNTAAVPDGWPGGNVILPSQVKESAREMMAAWKRDWVLSHPTLTTGGTGSAYTLTPGVALDAYVTGQIFAVKLNADILSNATLNISSLGAKKIYLLSRTTVVRPSGGEAKAGHVLFLNYDASLDGANGGFVAFAGVPPQPRTEAIAVGVTTNAGVVVVGTGLFSFRMPYALTLSAVRASLTSAQTSGSLLTIDINESGSTILSTKITLDNNETSSTTASTPPVISDVSLADDAIVTIDVDQVGNGTATGLKVYLIGKQP